MKNLFAFNNLGKLIHISEVNKRNNEYYTCINCGKELIAKKGKIKAHHFAHKAVLDCNFETYLHKLGKLIFYQTYNQCVEKNIPYYVEYETSYICSTCESNNAIKKTCELGIQVNKFDLTTRYDLVNIEKSYDGFIADILLESSKKEINDKIFIEIAVTHTCEIEKQESGIRIVEIKLNDEKDIKIIKEKSLNIENENINFYNFKTKTTDIRKPLNQCDKEFEVFSVLKNKKAIKRLVKAKNIQKILNDKMYVYNKILFYDNNESERFGGYVFIELVEEASNNGIDVKNCFVCRFFTYNNSYLNEMPYFCKRLKSGFDNTNIGADCNKFWRIGKTYTQQKI